MNTPTSSRYLIRLNGRDYLTLSSVLTSSLAVTLALKGQSYLATSALLIAMLGGAMDGIQARQYRQERPFARHLDSFVSAVIYLITPALLLYLHGMDGWWSLPLLAMVLCGGIRLSVLQETGNLQEEISSLDYPGMPVFWSVFLLVAFLLLDFAISPLYLHSLMSVALLAFSHAMLLRKPCFTFRKRSLIFGLILVGTLVFWVIHLSGSIPLA